MSADEPNGPREAMLYERLDDQAVQCRLCGHRCRIQAGRYGVCRVRENVEGALISRNYGRLVAAHVDPIEKKPLYHVLPGTRSFSVAAAGCNFQCSFCQNWQISQLPQHGKADAGEPASPGQIVQAARAQRCATIAYTYTEPTVYFELAYETARLAKEAGLRNVFVSNGFLTPLAVRTIAPYLDAINVDLKAFRDETYRQVMKARLEPVLDCLRALVEAGIWVEATTLIVPRMNDSDEELRDIARFLASLSPDLPWHVSRFHGDYKMTSIGPTPLERLETACAIGRGEGLRYIYQGNVAGPCGSDTLCPNCGRAVIAREGFSVRRTSLQDGRCGQCGQAIAGIWQ